MPVEDNGFLLLETALIAFDRMESARKLIEGEGMTFRDRWGQAKAHPGVVAVYTGKDMNTGDITQVEPNIHAGVKYISLMRDQFFAEAVDVERML